MKDQCSACNGTGRYWYMQGGPYGIGNYGKCPYCNGTGLLDAAVKGET